MVFPSYSHDFPIIFPSYSHDFPIIFPSHSHDFPIIFPSYSHDFPIIFPSYSHHIPMIFPSYSHHIPTISPSYSHDIPIIVPLFHRRKAENQLRARELVELRKLREGEPRRRRMGYGIRYPTDILRMEIYRWGMLGYSWWWIFMNEIDILHVFLGDYVKHFFLGNITMIDWELFSQSIRWGRSRSQHRSHANCKSWTFREWIDLLAILYIEVFLIVENKRIPKRVKLLFVGMF